MKPASIVLLLAALLGASGCRRAENKPGTAAEPVVETLVVRRTSEPIKLDGELDEPAWNAIAARTGPFVDTTGGEARPYSDARFLWDGENLYLGLYAADDDIRAKVTTHDGPVWIDDSFALHLTPAPARDAPKAPVSAPTYSFDISASGVVTDAVTPPGGKPDVTWESGIKLGVDRDGSLNDPADEDEEWVIEAAIPLRALGLEPKPGARVLIDLRRCDTPRNTKQKRCGAWGTARERKALELAP